MIALVPRSLDQALALKAEHPDAVPLAGGTDLVAGWSGGAPRPETLLVLSGVKGLLPIELSQGKLRVGAGASHAALAADAGVRERFPALARAAASVGAPAVRNMGTVGGNLVTASPAADLPPALLAYGAEAVAASSARGGRRVPLDKFFVDYRNVALVPDELLVRVELPVPAPNARCWFEKVGTRKAQACSKVSIAVYVEIGSGNRLDTVRIAAGSVAPVPKRLPETEQALTGQTLTPELAAEAGEAASREVVPIDDVRSTAEYRKHVVGGLVERFLKSLL